MAFRTNKVPVLQEKSASGSVASFNTALAMPLPSCKIAVNAWQEGSGTPSPDNVRTINGYSAIHIQNTCGINQWDEVWENGTINSTTGKNEPNSAYIRSKNYIRITPDTNYFYKTSAELRLVYYDANKAFVGIANANNTIALSPANAYYVRFYPNTSSYGSTYKNDISINFPATDTSYHAFVGQSVTIQIGSTVYGGEYDARTGVLTVTQVKEILRGSYFSAYSASIQCAVGGKPAGWLPWLKQTGGSCEMLSHGLPTTRSNIGNISNGCFIGDTTGGNQEVMYIKFAGYSSLEDVQAFIEAQYNSNTPVEVVYKLATPTTIQLPPCPIDTLEGVNNIFADTGDIDLTYKDLDIAKRGNFREVFRLPS